MADHGGQTGLGVGKIAETISAIWARGCKIAEMISAIWAGGGNGRNHFCNLGPGGKIAEMRFCEKTIGFFVCLLEYEAKMADPNGRKKSRNGRNDFCNFGARRKLQK